MSDLTPLLKDFLRAITPPPDKGPLDDLHERYAQREEERRRELLASTPFNYPHDSIEFMVEMRIREWVRRMETERKEMEQRRKADSDAPPHSPPPGKKIAPPRP